MLYDMNGGFDSRHKKVRAKYPEGRHVGGLITEVVHMLEFPAS